MGTARQFGTPNDPIQLRTQSSMDKVAQGLASMIGYAADKMADDVRHQAKRGITGGAKQVPKRDVLNSDGTWKKGSVARPWPKPPRSYTEEGNPIAISEIRYEKEGSEEMTIDGHVVKWPSYIIGPKGRGSGKVPKILHEGGTTNRYWRIEGIESVKTRMSRDGQTKRIQVKGKGTMRWRFSNSKKSLYQKISPSTGTLETYDATFLGPKVFQVRGRPYMTEPFHKVMQKGSRFLNGAKAQFRANSK